MQFIMNRIYLRIFGLTILLIQMALIGYTAFTVKELPHRYQQEFDNATKRLAIEEWSNHNDKISYLQKMLFWRKQKIFQ